MSSQPPLKQSGYQPLGSENWRHCTEYQIFAAKGCAHINVFIKSLHIWAFFSCPCTVRSSLFHSCCWDTQNYYLQVVLVVVLLCQTWSCRQPAFLWSFISFLKIRVSFNTVRVYLETGVFLLKNCEIVLPMPWPFATSISPLIVAI